MKPKEKEERKKFKDELNDRLEEKDLIGWDEDPAAGEWFAKAKTERTLKNWRDEFKWFVAWSGLSPSAMIEKRQADLKSDDRKVRGWFEDKLIEYAKDLAARHFSKTTIQGRTSRVQSFFKHMRLGLVFARGDLDVELTRAGKMAARQKTFSQRTAAQINLDIRRMYDMADVTNRVILMFGYQLGFLPVDISHLMVGQIPINTNTPENDFIMWKHEREKTGEEIQTAFSPELIHDLKIHLLQRKAQVGELEEDPGYLFVSRLGIRLKENAISERLKRLGRAALGEDTTFSAKDLRDCFNVSLSECELNPEIKDRLYGHKPMGSRGSYDVSPKAIIEGYRKVFKLVSLNGWKQVRSDTKELKQRLENSEESITELKKLTARLMAALLLSDTPREAVGAILDELGGLPSGVSTQQMERMDISEVASIVERTLARIKS